MQSEEFGWVSTCSTVYGFLDLHQHSGACGSQSSTVVSQCAEFESVYTPEFVIYCICVFMPVPSGSWLIMN